MPLTMASPWPSTASMMSRSVVTDVGSAVKMTPDRSEATISWTMTAMAGSSSSWPFAR